MIGAWGAYNYKGQTYVVYGTPPEPTDLGSIVESLPVGTNEVTVSGDPSSLTDWLTAIGGDGTPENHGLPPNTSGQTIEITLNLAPGEYGSAQTVTVPEGYVLIVNGAPEAVIIEGGSPALTLVSGSMIVQNGVTFTNTTDAPTILVQGGTLTLRNVVVEETTGGDHAAIEITGGTVDLGTLTEPGGNTIDVRGDGEVIRNLTASPVPALGNSFQVDGAPLTDPFAIEDEVFHALDQAGLGLVSFVEGNVDPLIAIDAITPLVVAVGAPVSFAGSFADVGSLQSHTAVWTINAATLTSPIVVAGFVVQSLATGTVTISHAFDEPGVYSVTLTVNDDELGEGSASTLDGVTAMLVVYDPSGGFVTGGGWIDSPVGAYAADPSLSGRVSFGFQSKYKKGANFPTGETQFSFRVADLNFHSDTYEWLVVAGPQAKYKGTGTINGGGDYGFLLTAVDGQFNGGGGVDKFRITIWDRETGAVVYDNKMGKSDDSAAATELGGGQVVVHTGGQPVVLAGSAVAVPGAT